MGVAGEVWMGMRLGWGRGRRCGGECGRGRGSVDGGVKNVSEVGLVKC